MIHEVKVEFKTSELIIVDWINIPEFKDQVGPSELYSYDWMVQSTQEAARHNFVRVHVGDVMPNIFRKDNNFSFGLTSEKSKYTNIGQLYSGVWAVVVIETKNLIDIIANKVGHEKAVQLVDDFLNKQEYRHHTKVNVEPGIYTVKFNPEATHAKQMFTMRKDKVVKAKAFTI